MALKANTPFDQLLKEYGISRNTLVKKMVRDDLRGYEQTQSYQAEWEYRKDIRKKDISRYARKLREPSMTMFCYLSQLIGCSPEELLPTLKQNQQIGVKYGDREQDFIINLPNSPKPYFYVALLEIAIICLSSNFFLCRKYYRLKFLKDGCRTIKALDSYSGKVRQVEINNPKDASITIKTEEDEYCTHLNVHFNTMPVVEEEVTFTTDCYLNIPKEEVSNFHGIFINHPTNILAINLVPKNPQANKTSILRKYQKYSDYLNNCPKGLPRHLISKASSMSLRTEIKNPLLHSCYKLEWN